MRPVVRIDHRLVRKIVSPCIECRQVVFLRIPRRPIHPPHAPFDGQLVRRSPGVLNKRGPSLAIGIRLRPLADFGVTGEGAQRRVRDRRPGWRHVRELESAVLIVGAAGNRLDVDLVEIILARGTRPRFPP